MCMHGGACACVLVCVRVRAEPFAINGRSAVRARECVCTLTCAQRTPMCLQAIQKALSGAQEEFKNFERKDTKCQIELKNARSKVRVRPWPLSVCVHLCTAPPTAP